MTDINRQAAEIHEYIVTTIGHKWRLKTWNSKYCARLKNYSFEDCIIAIDGFKSQAWWMTNKSQDAPDVIFRSDKSFERFLAAGMKLPKHREPEISETKTSSVSFREKLESDSQIVTLTKRLHKRLEPIQEKINDVSWKAFFETLLYIRYEDEILFLFSEFAEWIHDHYHEMIEDTLGCTVKIVSEL